MDTLLIGSIVALGGGFVGAAIGGNFGFVMTGFTVWLGLAVAAATNNSVILDWIAFGPFVGPHVCFAGGVAAAAYAHRQGVFETGRDVTTPLAKLGRPDVLLVGAVFGLFGHLCAQGLAQIPWLGSNNDNVAMTVVISGLLARLLLSRQSLIVPDRFNSDGRGKYAPTDEWGWVRYQEKPVQLLALGLGFGIAAAGATLGVVHFAIGDGSLADGSAGDYSVLMANAQTLAFAFSAVTISFLCLGMPMPVQHHITLPAGLAAAKFLPVFAGGMDQVPGTGAYAGALIVGGLVGVIAGLVGEGVSRLVHQRGDSHIDPPAAAIFSTTIAVLGISGAILG